MIITGDTSLCGVTLCSGIFEMYRFFAFEMRELYCGFSEFFFPYDIELSENQNEGQRSISSTRISNNLRHILYWRHFHSFVSAGESTLHSFTYSAPTIKQCYLVFGITAGTIQQHRGTIWYPVDYGAPVLFLLFDIFLKCIPCPYFCWPRNFSHCNLFFVSLCTNVELRFSPSQNVILEYNFFFTPNKYNKVYVRIYHVAIVDVTFPFPLCSCFCKSCLPYFMLDFQVRNISPGTINMGL